MEKRQLLFIKDVFLFTFTAFGGAQAHISLLLKYFVKQTHYISEEDLLELNALAQILPGPASTQTLVGIAHKVGGLKLALITFLIWIIPSAAIMTFAAFSFAQLDHKVQFTLILKYIQPIALGIVAFGAYTLSRKVLVTQTAIFFGYFCSNCDIGIKKRLCISSGHSCWRYDFFCFRVSTRRK